MFNAFIFARTHTHVYITLDNDVYCKCVIQHNNHSFSRSLTYSLVCTFVRSFAVQIDTTDTYDVCVHSYICICIINSQNFCLFIWNAPWQYDAEASFHSSMLLQYLLTIVHFVFLSIFLRLHIRPFRCLLFQFKCRNESICDMCEMALSLVRISCALRHV